MDSKSYDELHGINNWDGLLDPLDQDLRSLIIGYGDLASAAERAFNDDQDSKYCGYCHYGKSSFFKGVMLPWAESKYEITSFIYATASSKLPWLFSGKSRKGSDFESNWMGYIAVSNDEYSKSIGRREICVVWRGTVRLYEWLDDILGAMPVPAQPLLPPGNGSSTTNLSGATITPHIMGGWLTIYNTSDPDSEFLKTSARTQLSRRINELLSKYKGENVSIVCTGHSLGACLATISAFDLAANVATPDINVSAFVFQSPQVGNKAFKSKMEELPNLKVLRVKNVPDVIPLWPSKILKWIGDTTWESVPSQLLEYVDVGIELPIDSQKSPYLKAQNLLTSIVHPLVFHNLEGVLHTLGGWTGENGEFDWSLEKRDLGLVNMSNNLLKEELLIPASWWAQKNKGMRLNDDGHWVLSPAIDRGDQDLPVY